MQITEERLQEIKNELSVWSEHHMKSGIIPELIAAVEQAQAELAKLEYKEQYTEHLMTSPTDRWVELIGWLDKAGYINQSFLLKCKEERDNFCKQLAEDVTKCHKVSTDCDVLRQELADMEVERIALEHGAAHVEAELTKQLGEARAKIERLELTEYG